MVSLEKSYFPRMRRTVQAAQTQCATLRTLELSDARQSEILRAHPVFPRFSAQQAQLPKSILFNLCCYQCFFLRSSFFSFFYFLETTSSARWEPPMGAPQHYSPETSFLQEDGKTKRKKFSVLMFVRSLMERIQLVRKNRSATRNHRNTCFQYLISVRKTRNKTNIPTPTPQLKSWI